MAEVDAFVRLVRDGGPNRSPGRGALDAMRVAAAADRAIAEHRPVAVTDIKSWRRHRRATLRPRWLPFEDDVIGLVVRAVGYGAEREHFGHGEMLSQPGGQQVGAVHHRRRCVEAPDV